MIKMTFKRKITALTLGILISAMAITLFLSLMVINDKVKENISEGIADTAIAISQTPLVQEELTKGNYSNMKVQNYIEKIRLKTGIYFITVMDMEGIRYSHPLVENIGKPFLGGDHLNCILYGERYVSEGVGSLGRTIRAFEPVYNDGVRVGAVCVGLYKEDFSNQVRDYIKALIPIFIIICIFTILAAARFAKSIKKSIYGLEPEEIGVLFAEKEAIINNMNEGLIAVDKTGEISLINSRAKEILKISEKKEVDIKILELLMESIYRRSRIINLEMKVNKDIVILANFYTLFGEDGKSLGAIISFQDLTDVKKLAEELTGIKELTWNLRAQNHEFMNKLHTIAGMIQLEEYDEALEYIFDTSSARGFITESIKKIKETSLQGLIFAKYNKADEAKIRFEFDDESYLDSLPKNLISQELLTVVGNLLENSIEELREREDGYIYLKITQEESINIIVKNNGRRITEEQRDDIFKRGYSSKGEGRGFGMYNLCSIIKDVGGEISLESTDEITTWSIKM